MRVDTSPVVGPVVQRLVARRLGRAGMTLGAVLALALLEIALVDLSRATHATTLAGPFVAGAGLLAMGFRSVRRAFGDRPRPWMALASASGVLPFVFGSWLLIYRGLRAFAVSGGMSLLWLIFALWAALGLRLLLDTVKVSELQRLASTMLLPSPGEPRRGAGEFG